MTYKEIQELIRLVVRLELAELKLRDGEFEISVRTKEYAKAKGMTPVAPAVVSVAPVAAPPIQDIQPKPATIVTPSEEKQAKEDSTGHFVEIKSPIVGTFYRSPGPDKGPFVKVGDTVHSGDVVCIVEAMKLFNEIESEVSGKIVKVLVEDANPVEYDQALFLVDPKG